MGLSIGHLLVLLAIATIVFGTKRLRGAGKDLGDAVRGFREGLHGNTDGQPNRD